MNEAVAVKVNGEPGAPIGFTTGCTVVLGPISSRVASLSIHNPMRFGTTPPLVSSKYKLLEGFDEPVWMADDEEVGQPAFYVNIGEWKSDISFSKYEYSAVDSRVPEFNDEVNRDVAKFLIGITQDVNER